jgi:hypothetical protein
MHREQNDECTLGILHDSVAPAWDLDSPFTMTSDLAGAAVFSAESTVVSKASEPAGRDLGNAYTIILSMARGIRGRFILGLGLTRVSPTSRGDIRVEVRARLGSPMLDFLALEPAP